MKVQSFDGVFPLRRSEKPWTAEEVAQVVLKAEPALPHLLKASRLAKTGVPPLAVAAVKAGLEIDPEHQGLLDVQKDLNFLGWDTFETTAPATVGNLEMRTYHATGKYLGRMMRPALEWQAVFTEKDSYHHAYTLRNYMTLPPSYQLIVNGPDGTQTVCRLNRALTQEELVQAVLKAEAAGAEARKGRELLAAAFDMPTAEQLFAAAAAYRAALKLDPEYVHLAEQLVRCYLFVSDLEAGTENEAVASDLEMGAIERLAALEPDSAVGHMALGVCAYRFGAYPLAVEHLRKIVNFQSTQARALEILGILEATGQSEYRPGEAFEFDTFRIQPCERVTKPDAPPLPDGARVAEMCFIGTKDGNYRFNFTYREQKIHDAVMRDLVFTRAGRSAIVRTFEKAPSVQELKEEILKALTMLTAK
jgi:tetratricopeptide (TPR) repeat protein